MSRMNNQLHFFDVSPFLGTPFVSDLKMVMGYFSKYPQNIIEEKTHVLRGNKDVKVMVKTTVRPKVVFVHVESPMPASNPDENDYQNVLMQFDNWYDELIEKVTRMAGIRPP